jgi:FtsZ-binding cell division protein ZapB
MTEETKDNEVEFNVETLPAEMQAMATKACQSCVDLRSIAIVFDWEGNYNNNPDIPMGIWTDEVGPVRPYDISTIQGSLTQTAKLVASQASTAMDAITLLNKKLEELSQESRKLGKHVDIQKSQLEESEQQDNNSRES